MKKVLIGLVAVIIVVGGGLYFAGYFDKAGATEDDLNKGEEIVDELKDIYDNVEMPGFEEEFPSDVDIADSMGSLIDSMEAPVDEMPVEGEEEFDPEAML